MEWSRHKHTWPNADLSRFVRTDTLRWHVQIGGSGPPCLLLHGAGAATHSWRHLLPLLATRFTVISPDLPGHAFTRRSVPRRSDLPTMAKDLDILCREIGYTPEIIIGHSAGAAIAIEIASRNTSMNPPSRVVGLNAALSGFEGAAGFMFPRMARLLASAPPVPWVTANILGTTGQIQRLLRETGSQIDAEGIDLYRRVASDPAHIAGTLDMFSQWSLHNIPQHLSRISCRTDLFYGTVDRMVPPGTSIDAAKFGQVEAHPLPGLGHLAHEEAPGLVAEKISEATLRNGSVVRNPI